MAQRRYGIQGMPKRIRRSDMKLGELLLARGSINRDQLNLALREQHSRVSSQACLGDILLELSFIREDQLIEAFLDQYMFPYIPLSAYDIDRDILSAIPAEIALKHSIFPLERNENTLTVVMSNPLHDAIIKHIEDINRCVVIPCLTRASDIRKAVNYYYNND